MSLPPPSQPPWPTLAEPYTGWDTHELIIQDKATKWRYKDHEAKYYDECIAIASQHGAMMVTPDTLGMGASYWASRSSNTYHVASGHQCNTLWFVGYQATERSSGTWYQSLGTGSRSSSRNCMTAFIEKVAEYVYPPANMLSVAMESTAAASLLAVGSSGGSGNRGNQHPVKPGSRADTVIVSGTTVHVVWLTTSCAGSDKNCQALDVCQQVTGYTCSQQSYSCNGGGPS